MKTIKTNKEIDEKYLLKKGDIILRLTPPYTSQLIEFTKENTTTTSNYAIIKVKPEYSPEIINFYLNSEYTKKQIYQTADETSIKAIKIKNIKEFNIKQVKQENKESYIQLIKTYKKKKQLIEQQLEIEKDLLEEIIFGDK